MFVLLFLSLASAPAPEERALAYLAREVPAWPAENKCYSCHHSGVAAGALLVGRRLGLAPPADALTETLRWLEKPEQWDRERPEKEEDGPLALIQFAAALVDADDAKAVRAAEPLQAAARKIAAEQKADGSWAVSAPGTRGSPATLGPALATHLARRTLHRAGGHDKAVDRATSWLRSFKAENVPDASAQLLALVDDKEAEEQRRRCREILRRSEDRDGGWGPTSKEAVEPFDTALALLALTEFKGEKGVQEMIERGRKRLVALQEDDGGWPATTRPAGRISHAQRVATTGWATRALLATRR